MEPTDLKKDVRCRQSVASDQKLAGIISSADRPFGFTFSREVI